MLSTKLFIYIYAKNGDALSALFAGCALPENVSMQISVTETLPEFEKEQDTLVITDQLSFLNSVPFSRYPLLQGILLADNPDSAAFPDACEVWPLMESDALRLRRFRTWIRHFSEQFNSWLYQNFLMSTIDMLPDMIWYKSADGLHWIVNHAFEDVVHKTRAQVRGQTHNYIWDVPPEDGGKSEFHCIESEREVMEKKRLCIMDEHVKMGDEMRYVLTYKAPLFNRIGEVMGTVGMGHDVTDLNNASLEIKMLLENLPFPLLLCDNHFHPLQINSKFENEFGIPRDSITELDYIEWKTKNFKPTTEQRINDDQHYSIQEMSTTQDDGDQALFMVTEQQILDYFGNISGYYCMFRDVTIEREYEQMILEFANTDALTKLYNRRYFYEYLARNRGNRITIVFMDIDNFKLINDTLGHLTGDTALCTTAETIVKAFPEGLTARLGGDEFATALIGETDEKELVERCQKLTRDIEDKFRHMKLDISLSCGLAVDDGTLADIDAFVHQSDEKMYQVKKTKVRHPRK